MNEKAEIFEFGPFRVDVPRRSVEREGHPIALTGKAFEILVVLLHHRGEAVDKDTLLRQVWPDTVVEENNITVAMSALRKALGETPANPKWIVTIPGRGYSFVGELRSAPQTPPAESPAIAPQSTPAHSRIPLLLIATSVILAFAAIILFAAMHLHWFSPKPARTLAILPFGMLNKESKDDYLGLGLTDALITRLENTQIIVRPLATVSRFANHDPIQSGRDLGVDAVVEGNVQTAADRIRVSVRLLRVRDGQPLWAETFDVPSGNAFSLEDSIAERVASNLLGHLSGQQQNALNKRPTENATAYANYMRGRYYAANFYTKDGYNQALQYLQNAINEDPGYALAYSGLADTYYDSSNLTYPPNESMPRAKLAAQKAVELDPSLAAAHVSLGVVASKYDWNWPAADKEFKSALAIDPNLATAHLWFGLFRAQMGDFDRAVAELQRAQQLDPLSGEINAYYGLVLFWARRYDDSIHQFHQAITFDPMFIPNYVGLCWALDAKGDTKAALDACTQAVERGASPWTSLALARAQALAGDRTAAAATMASVSRQRDLFISGYDQASVHAALGHADEAFAALEQGYQSRAEWMVYLKIDPQMDTLRHDPRYTAMIKRVGL